MSNVYTQEALIDLLEKKGIITKAELLGTWLAIITERVWAPNPFNDPHKMYCSAFVRYCYQQAGRDFLGDGVALSNTAPEHIAQSGPFKAEWHR